MDDLLDDDDVEIVVPLSPDTAKRLFRFARAVGCHPDRAAGALLRDLLVDDEFWNAAAETETMQ